jgi:hypothetical protein
MAGVDSDGVVDLLLLYGLGWMGLNKETAG